MKTDNELIAEFMGFGLLDETPVSKTKIFKLTDKNGDPIHPYYGPMQGEQMRFGSSWDWLMPVVEKIESLYFYVEIKGNDCYITETGGEDDRVHPWLKGFDEIYCDRGSKIKSTYESTVQFIKWYNEQKS